MSLLTSSIAEHKYPYEVYLFIKRSDLIPVADITSSDPFWKVYYDKRYIDETSVKKRQLTADWKEEFHFRVPSVTIPLELRLYDDDENKPSKDDDFLGKVLIPLNGPTDSTSQTVDVTLTPQYVTQNKRTTLEFTLSVTRTELPTIQLVSSSPSVSSYVSAAESLESWIPPRTLTSLGKITRRLLEEYNSLYHPSRYEILELINDISSLKASHSPSFAKPSTDNHSQQFITRKKLILESSTKVSFSSKKENNSLSTARMMIFERHSPIETNSIQLNLNSSETHFYLLTFESRFLMWHWFKWFSFALSYWKQQELNNNGSSGSNPSSFLSLPSWAKKNNKTFSTQVLLQSHKAMNKSKPIMLKLDFHESFQLFFDNISIELENLDSMIISIDSKVPCQWVTELTVTETDNETFDEEDNYVLNHYFIQNGVDSYRVKNHEEYLLLDVTNETTLENASSDFLDITTFEESGRSIKLSKQGMIDFKSSQEPVVVLDKKIGDQLFFFLFSSFFSSLSLFSLLPPSV
jgi:hypothetical protein